jgi:hypothetical protein
MPYVKVGEENSGAIAWTHRDQVNKALLDFLT